MSIERFYTTSFEVSRPEAGEDGRSEVTSLGSFMGHLQQATTEEATKFAQGALITHFVWCGTDTDVKAGDTLSADGRTYSVRGVQKNELGGNPHLMLLAEQDKT